LQDGEETERNGFRGSQPDVASGGGAVSAALMAAAAAAGGGSGGADVAANQLDAKPTALANLFG
jgi:hypothetical protein